MQKKLEELGNYLKNKKIQYEVKKYNIKSDYKLVSKVLGIPIESIAKTMVLKSENKKYIICILPNLKKIDYDKLEKITGERYRLADETESEILTDCKVGAITFLMIKSSVDVFMDEELISYENIRNCKWNKRL